MARLVHPDDNYSTDHFERIGGFDLATGELFWERRLYLHINALLPNRGQLLALHAIGSRITVLDPRDGHIVAHRRLHGWRDSASPHILRASGDRLAVISNGGCNRPVRAYSWR